MASTTDTSGRVPSSTQEGVAKRKRGRPRRIPLEDPTPTPTPSHIGQGRNSGHSPVSFASENKNMTELEEHINDLGDSWETESLFENILDDMCEETKEALDSADFVACTSEETQRFRQELRAIGPEEFCRRTVDSGVITAKRLLTAFGVRPPGFLEGEPDESYFGLLSLALSRELQKRAKLIHYNTVDDAVHLLQTSRNIIVITGAGISTSLGIPDFRSKNTGLYSRLAHLGLSDPQEVFDIQVFKEDPTIFYSVARDILPSTDRFTPTHAFIAMLQQKGKLLTNYSQNIDNLEAKAGINPSKLVQCHGSFATASCVTCGYCVEGESIYPTIKAGQIPRCPRCADKLRQSAASVAAADVAAAAAAAAVTAAQDARRQRKLLLREAASEGRGADNDSLSLDSSFDDISSAGGGEPTPATRGRGRPRGRPPGKVGRPPGKVGRPPGKVGRPPGKVGRPPGKVGRPPGKVGRPPGKVGRPPGKVGRPPGKVGQPPGQVGRPRGRPRRQRSDDEDDDEDDDNSDLSPSSSGVMKPGITFFGEPLPDEFSRRLTEHDRDRADLVVVIGTSLKVAPVSEVVPYMPPHVPQIYISRTPVSHINFDIDLLGDCDVVISELCRRAGWDLQHEMIPPNQQVHVETPPGEFASRHVFTDMTIGVVKPDENTAPIGLTPVGTMVPAANDRKAPIDAGNAHEKAMHLSPQTSITVGLSRPVARTNVKLDTVFDIREISVVPSPETVSDVSLTEEDTSSVV
ncbi:NAD-dependent histone deacetylase sir2 [Sporothrix epigloea]|uniref:NAD-dependent histone deacetylase sir2 n=1 Tax=Sporothrix epigloea TaxID=1892477 RepID=A0ABP0DYK5_9PEZI